MKERKETLERNKTSKNYNKKQKNNCKVIKNEKGITLIILVITIIIIIILSSVAVNMVFGDNGLITKSELARNLTENSVAYEEGSLTNVLVYLDELIGDDSGVTAWDTSKVKAVVSEDGETVPVPIGYTASEADGEKSVAGGFVIYEGETIVNNNNVSDERESRNQFVWVPVKNIDDIATKTDDGNYQGKLYNFTENGKTEISQSTTNYREPDIVSSDENSTYLTILGLSSSSEFKEQLQREFNEMIESIKTYGGFYIGRYETGNIKTEEITEPVVVKGRDDIATRNWYYMYQSSKLIAEGSSVASTMIWGCLWDRTLIWLAETNEESNGIYGKSYKEIANSSDWGNYSTNERKTTGSNESYKANNIYDLAGNMWEWTIEAYSTTVRVIRGGSAINAGSASPVSIRSTSDPSGSDDENVRRIPNSTLY